MGQHNNIIETWKMCVCVCVYTLKEQGGEKQKQLNNCESWARVDKSSQDYS